MQLANPRLWASLQDKCSGVINKSSARKKREFIYFQFWLKQANLREMGWGESHDTYETILKISTNYIFIIRIINLVWMR